MEKELRHQECVLDKKLEDDASIEEKKERERERGSTELKEEKGERSMNSFYYEDLHC